MQNPTEEGWHKLQPYVVSNVSRAYYQLFATKTFKEFFETCEDDSSRKMFEKLYLLTLKTFILEDGGYFRSLLSKSQFNAIKREVAESCSDL